MNSVLAASATWVLAALLVLIAGQARTDSAAAKLPIALSHSIDPPRQPPGQFYNVSAVAAGPRGDIYVMDSDNHRVLRYSADGTYLGQFGEFGARDGQFVNLTSLMVDPDGTVYVGDQYSFVDGKPTERLQHFDAVGHFIGQAASVLTGAIGPDHTLYRATQYPARILRYDETGSLLGSWGTTGSGDGQFGPVVVLAVADDGTVYVADHHNHRIQYFTRSGRYLGKWGSRGTGDGQFSGLLTIAVDRDGVYVSDVGQDGYLIHVQRFTRSGGFIHDTLPLHRSMTERVGGIAAGPDGALYVNAVLPGEIRRYTPYGELLSKWGGPVEENVLAGGTDVSVARDGSIVLVDGAHLIVLGPLGELKSSIDLSSLLPADDRDLYFLRAVETASDGKRYVVRREVEWLPGDEALVRVSYTMVQLEPSNMVAQTWSLGGGVYEFSLIPLWPVYAAAPDNSVYVLDRASLIMRRFSEDGRLLSEWQLPKPYTGYFSEASDIDVAQDGSIFAVRYWWDADERVTPPAPRVQRFDPDGVMEDEWRFDDNEVRAQGPSSHNSYALALGASSKVYLGAKYGWDAGELQCFTAGGELLTRWGRAGFGPYREDDRIAFWPIAMDATEGDDLVVVDNMPGLQSSFVRLFGTVSREWWRIRYFGDRDMTGWPIVAERVMLGGGGFRRDWGDVGPVGSGARRGFAARADGEVRVEGGRYCFGVESEGGIRVWVDDDLLVDRWSEVAYTGERCAILPRGTHRLFIDYVDSGSWAKVTVDWRLVTAGSSVYLPVARQQRVSGLDLR